MFDQPVVVHPSPTRILLEPVEVEEKTKSGLLLTSEHAKEHKPTIALVVEVGAQVDNKPQVGSHVFYSAYGVTSINAGDKTYLLAQSEDIIASIWIDDKEKK